MRSAQVFGDREHARAITHRSADRRRVQRHIMKYRMNAVAFQVLDEPRSRLQVFDENVEHMEIAGAMLRDRLNPNRPGVDQRRQAGGIAVVDATTQCGYFLHCLELGKKHCGQQIGGDIGRADIHPGIFIDFAAKELAAIGPLFANDFGAARQIRIVRQESACLPGNEVFRIRESCNNPYRQWCRDSVPGRWR